MQWLRISPKMRVNLENVESLEYDSDGGWLTVITASGENYIVEYSEEQFQRLMWALGSIV